MYSDHTQKYVLATKFDFTLFDNASTIEFIKVFPTKGFGGTEFRIEEITLKDHSNSKALADLKAKLEALELPVKLMEYQDV